MRPLSERVREHASTAELAGHRRIHGWADEIAKLEAERDLAKRHLDAAYLREKRLEAERDRLRDACRAVISAYDGRGVFRATYDTVRAALEGGEG